MPSKAYSSTHTHRGAIETQACFCLRVCVCAHSFSGGACWPVLRWRIKTTCFPLSFETRSLTEPRAPHSCQTDWPGSPWDPPASVPFSSSGVSGLSPHTLLLRGCRGSKRRHSCLAASTLPTSLFFPFFKNQVYGTSTGKAKSHCFMNLLSHVTGPPQLMVPTWRKEVPEGHALGRCLVTAQLCPSSILSSSLLPGLLRVSSMVSQGPLSPDALKATEAVGNGQKPMEAQTPK